MQAENLRYSADARRISIARLIAATLAALLTAAAGFFVRESWQLDRRFDEWVEAKPMSLEVDFSRPGVFSAPFVQTCSVSHGEVIHLLVESPDGTAAVTAEQLVGLDARIVIADADGDTVVDRELAAPTHRELREDEVLALAYFHPFSVGDYSATITVMQGAPALSGTKQTLFAKYHLCGMERFLIYIARLLAAICGIPALILGAIALRGFIKHGLWKHRNNHGLHG